VAARTQLINARLQQHWTQEQAAGLAGVSARAWISWEQGTMPRLSSIEQVCKLFACSAEELGFELAAPADKTAYVSLIGTTVVQPLAGSIDTYIAHNLTTRLLTLAFTCLESFQALYDTMISIIEDYTMDMDKTTASLTRRDALRNLVAFPLVALGLSSFSQEAPRKTTHPEDILTQCAAGITACRELSKGTDSSDLALAFDGISAYTPILKNIVKESSQYRKRAANLVAQCARIKTALGRIGWHQENLQQATLNAQEAVAYAREADDAGLVISSLLSLAWVYYYDHRSQQGLQALQEALSVLKRNPSLPHSMEVRIYSAQAVLSATTGEPMQGMLRLAHAALPKVADSDYYIFSDVIVPELTGNEALAYYHAREYAKATATFEQLINPEDLTRKLPLSGKAYGEMLNFMTLSSLKNPKKDRELSLHTWDGALQSAKKLQSRQRFDEVRAAYEVMDTLWPDTQAVKDRRDLIMQW
jgi:tetratricopeptide (TPR) repeat protein/transcriptional regulator with XRE-family HTH domain